MSFVNFTPISGSRNEQPLCYLLEIDEAHILLDCGWSDMFNVDDIQLMLKLAPRIDCLLLSHADLDHLGALPFLLKNGLNCPIYSSIPTHNMGALAVLDAYISRSDSESFSLFNNHDIDSAFDQIHQLRYSQHVILSGRASGITITAHRAGHSIVLLFNKGRFDMENC